MEQYKQYLGIDDEKMGKEFSQQGTNLQYQLIMNKLQPKKNNYFPRKIEQQYSKIK
ncbi:hypothetical protein ACEW7V_01620 [Areca yellow leaf disease phytoplasma]|uniref:hypothetical protein n=1 Tax=Areca yellow leaf disease phytoplasma TaxID=927614 RepID=UPI0035B5532B